MLETTEKYSLLGTTTLSDTSPRSNEGTSFLYDSNGELDVDLLSDLDGFNTSHEHSSASNTQAPSFKDRLLGQCKFAFLETYTIDGLDIRRKKIATSKGYQRFCKAEEDCARYTLSWGLIIATFLGLPTRLEEVIKDSSGPILYTLHLSFMQFIRGLVGGWDPLFENDKLVMTPKKMLQIFALPIKVLIILPLKVLVVFPFKLLVNIAKLFSEFLPSIGTFIFAPLLSDSFQGLRESFTNQKFVWWQKLLSVAGYLIATLVVLIPFLLLRALKFFGMTVTSPDKSARLSYTSVKKSVKQLIDFEAVKSRPYLQSAVKGLSYFLGAVSAILSVLTTAGLWAIIFPLAFGAVMTYIPLIQQAILTISQFPLIATFLTSLESTLAVVGIGTAHAYGAFIATISGYFGVQITTMVLLVGTAFGALAAPGCSAASRIADALSDWWATWNKQPFFEHLLTLFVNTRDTTLSASRGSSEVELKAMGSGDVNSPSEEVVSVFGAGTEREVDCLLDDKQADGYYNRAKDDTSSRTVTGQPGSLTPPPILTSNQSNNLG